PAPAGRAGPARAAARAAGDELVAGRGGGARHGTAPPVVPGLVASGGTAGSAGSGQRGLPGAGRREPAWTRAPGTLSPYAPGVMRITQETAELLQIVAGSRLTVPLRAGPGGGK